MNPMLRHKLPLVALALWCVALLGVRFWYSHDHADDFLLFNLALALVPFVSAALLRALPAGKSVLPVKAVLFAAWLAFLPNAPYLVTDLVHLHHAAPVPYWFDVALFGSYAATGVLLGYAAVADVDAVLSAQLGPVAGAVAAFGSLLLCGFGIYLGRFLRWNSWDVLTAPRALAHQAVHELAHPISHPGPWEVSIVYGVGLVLGYLALRGFASAVAAPVRRAAA